MQFFSLNLEMNREIHGSLALCKQWKVRLIFCGNKDLLFWFLYLREAKKGRKKDQKGKRKIDMET